MRSEVMNGIFSALARPLENGTCEIVTGVNLPMVIKLADQGQDEDLDELVRKIEMQGRKHISVAGKLLEP